MLLVIVNTISAVLNQLLYIMEINFVKESNVLCDPTCESVIIDSSGHQSAYMLRHSNNRPDSRYELIGDTGCSVDGIASHPEIIKSILPSTVNVQMNGLGDAAHHITKLGIVHAGQGSDSIYIGDFHVLENGSVNLFGLTAAMKKYKVDFIQYPQITFLVWVHPRKALKFSERSGTNLLVADIRHLVELDASEPDKVPPSDASVDENLSIVNCFANMKNTHIVAL
jgi:hypothetical protein